MPPLIPFEEVTSVPERLTNVAVPVSAGEADKTMLPVPVTAVEFVPKRFMTPFTVKPEDAEAYVVDARGKNDVRELDVPMKFWLTKVCSMPFTREGMAHP